MPPENCIAEALVANKLDYESPVNKEDNILFIQIHQVQSSQSPFREKESTPLKINSYHNIIQGTLQFVVNVS